VLHGADHSDRHDSHLGGGPLREILGFVCRWGVFALGGVGCACIALVSVLTADTSAGELCATMIVPDAIYPRQGDPRRLVWGYVQPELPYPAPILSVCHAQDGPLLLVDGDGLTLYPVVEAPDEGLYRVTVTGVPHGAVAFQQETALLRIIPDGRKVFLIDAAMYLDAPAPQQGELRGCLAEMRRRGEPALFDAGTRHDFLAHRAKLRVLHAEMPILWTPQDIGNDLATLRRAAHPLRPNCLVITDRPVLAARAAAAGFPTELIALAGFGGSVPRGVTAHDSPATFKEYLATQPITR